MAKPGSVSALKPMLPGKTVLDPNSIVSVDPDLESRSGHQIQIQPQFGQNGT